MQTSTSKGFRRAALVFHRIQYIVSIVTMILCAVSSVCFLVAHLLMVNEYGSSSGTYAEHIYPSVLMMGIYSVVMFAFGVPVSIGSAIFNKIACNEVLKDTTNQFLPLGIVSYFLGSEISAALDIVVYIIEKTHNHQ